MTIEKNQRALAQLSALYRPGTLNLIGGRPGMGKTTLAFQLATEAQLPTAYFSLKMKREQLLLRHSTGQCPEWIHLDDTATLTVDSVREKVRQLRETHDIRWVIIDYLQLMVSPIPNTDRGTELAAILEELKAMAVELQVAVIALTQLMRTVMLHDDYRPILQDVHDWERIGQWVDDVRLLHRDDYYNIRDGKRDTLEISATECQNGDVGNLQLTCFMRSTALNIILIIREMSDTDTLRKMFAATEKEILRVAKPLPQFRRRRDLLCPAIQPQSLLFEAPWPQPIHQYPAARRLVCQVIYAQDFQRTAHGISPPRRQAASDRHPRCRYRQCRSSLPAPWPHLGSETPGAWDRDGCSSPPDTTAPAGR